MLLRTVSPEPFTQAEAWIVVRFPSGCTIILKLLVAGGMYLSSVGEAKLILKVPVSPETVCGIDPPHPATMAAPKIRNTATDTTDFLQFMLFSPFTVFAVLLLHYFIYSYPP